MEDEIYTDKTRGEFFFDGEWFGSYAVSPANVRHFSNYLRAYANSFEDKLRLLGFEFDEPDYESRLDEAL